MKNLIKNDLYVLTLERREIHVVDPSLVIDIKLSDIEKLLKKAYIQKKKFPQSFIHLTDKISFFVDYENKRSK